MEKDQSVMKKIIEEDYMRRVKTFRALPIEDKNVILGDSLVAYLNHRLYHLNDWVNMGIAGDTTVGVLNRLDAVIRLKPRKVILSIGSNNLVLTDLTIDESIDQILEIVSTLQEFSDVYVLSITPVNSKTKLAKELYIAGRTNDDVNQMNQKLKLKLKNHYIDIASALKDQDGLLREELTTDGIHLNHEGYIIMIEKLSTILF